MIKKFITEFEIIKTVCKKGKTYHLAHSPYIGYVSLVEEPNGNYSVYDLKTFAQMLLAEKEKTN